MSLIDVMPPAFARLNLPPVEEYQKRKVALISGMGVSIGGGALLTFENWEQALRGRMDLICESSLDGACDTPLCKS